MKRISIISFILSALNILPAMATDGVQASVDDNRAATLQNDLIEVKIDKDGRVSYIGFKNGLNLLSPSGTFYFSAQEDKSVSLAPTKAEIKKSDADYAEIVYTNDTARIWKQQGYILKKGESKLYTYIILKGTDRKCNMEEARMTYRLGEDFIDGYVNADMQGMMPTVAQMKAFTDDDKIQDATYRLPDGTIYTKYDWATYLADDTFHGAMNTSHNAGIWALQPSAEYVNGGPMRQDLTVHMDDRTPVICQYLHSGHFGVCGKQEIGSDYKKIFGPMAIYINSGTREEMIADAKRQAEKEKEAWPYTWFSNEMYANDRGTVSGKINLTNYKDGEAGELEVVLSQADVDPYMQYKGNAFWSKTESDGSFSIANVTPGTYSLYVYANKGEITGTFEHKNVNVAAGKNSLGEINWSPERHATMLWRIGESDRMSDGFNLSDKARQYSNFTLLPADLTFRIGESNAETDWYYAQTKKGKWDIIFNLPGKPSSQCYLTASVAAATKSPSVTLKVNNTTITTLAFDNDGAIYRSAMRSGRHSLHVIKIPAAVFRAGENTVTLQMDKDTNGGGVMWDCIKLETDSPVTGMDIINEDNTHKSKDFYSLTGIRTENPTRGIFIHDGKKIAKYN